MHPSINAVRDAIQAVIFDATRPERVCELRESKSELCRAIRHARTKAPDAMTEELAVEMLAITQSIVWRDDTEPLRTAITHLKAASELLWLQPDIPAAKRTKPMTKRQAATILRPGENPKAAVRWLSKSIDEGSYRFQKLPGSNKGYFHLDDDWPDADRDKLTK